jgi:Tol biopolymer transport system component
VLAVLAAGGADARRAFAPEPTYADFGPVVSPDGTKIAFLREGITPARFVRYQSLYTAGVNGRGALALTQGAVQSPANDALGHFDGVVSASWSPDGIRLVYARNYAGSRRDYVHTELVIVNADGTNPRQLTTTDASNKFMRASFPSWSRARNQIVFADAGHIGVINPDGSGLTQLTDGPYDSDPAWSPDGSEIAFITGGDDHVSVMKADGTGVRMVSPLPARTPAWSPDGKTLVFSAKEGQSADIYTVGADGVGQRRLTNNAAEDITPSWMPDGRSILFGSNRGRGVYNGDLWVMKPDGSNQRRLIPLAAKRAWNGRRCTTSGTRAPDALVGTSRADVLCGLGSGDLLAGTGGSDVIDGGAGADLILARDRRKDVIQGGPGKDSARIDKGLDKVSGVEKLIP